ncbi:hypothetical protein C6497_10485 [Candidatus Poribacteria bacterium]|nr:MAG: hypothetical protein C6497_10485 [Candidatus Poribacteria bacterium]
MKHLKPTVFSYIPFILFVCFLLLFVGIVVRVDAKIVFYEDTGILSSTMMVPIDLDSHVTRRGKMFTLSGPLMVNVLSLNGNLTGDGKPLLSYLS